jgi:hypothetical protein
VTSEYVRDLVHENISFVGHLDCLVVYMFPRWRCAWPFHPRHIVILWFAIVLYSYIIAPLMDEIITSAALCNATTHLPMQVASEWNLFHYQRNLMWLRSAQESIIWIRASCNCWNGHIHGLGWPLLNSMVLVCTGGNFVAISMPSLMLHIKIIWSSAPYPVLKGLARL